MATKKKERRSGRRRRRGLLSTQCTYARFSAHAWFAHRISKAHGIPFRLDIKYSTVPQQRINDINTVRWAEHRKAKRNSSLGRSRLMVSYQAIIEAEIYEVLFHLSPDKVRPFQRRSRRSLSLSVYVQTHLHHLPLIVVCRERMQQVEEVLFTSLNCTYLGTFKSGAIMIAPEVVVSRRRSRRCWWPILYGINLDFCFVRICLSTYALQEIFSNIMLVINERGSFHCYAQIDLSLREEKMMMMTGQRSKRDDNR